MAQPTPYNRLYNFTEYATANPSAPYQAAYTDAELSAIEATLDGLCANAALIQRDDGALRNQVVTPDSLSATTLVLMSSADWTIRGAWLTTTAYVVGDLVEQGGTSYVCAIAHTSGTFSTDRTAGKWVVIGPSSALTSANNLSDVASAATSRTNLGVPGLATANTFTATAYFSSFDGARIHRLNDRLFVGAATDNDGGFPAQNVTKDWLETERASSTSVNQMAVLSKIGQGAIMGASRTSDFATAASMGCIGITGWGINDNATQVQSAYAGYFEARKKTGAGTTVGIEIDLANQGSVVAVIPTSMTTTGTTVNLWLTAGGGGASGATRNSAAIGIFNNTQTFDKGIVFGASALTGTEAISLASSYSLVWYTAGGGVASKIASTVATAANALSLFFTDSGAVFNNASGDTQFLLQYVASAVNYLQLSPAAAGSGPTLACAGTTADQNLNLQPAGVGLVNATTAFAVAATQVVGARNTGWSAMTGTANENTVYDTATVTLAQLAGRVMALQAALTTHGLIGT